MNILHVWKEQDEDRSKGVRKRGCWNPKHSERSRFARMSHAPVDSPEQDNPHPDSPADPTGKADETVESSPRS